MTITTEVNKAVIPADGIQVDFDYDFVVLEETHMNVYLDNILEPTANWSITGLGAQAGGTVTMATAPAASVKITLLRIVPNNQLIDYSAYGPFPAETHERALDLRVMEAQQAGEEIARSIRFALDTTDAFDPQFPSPIAGRAWKITSDGLGVEHTDVDIDEAISESSASAAAAAASEAAASVSENAAAADLLLTNADAAQTALDVIATAADVVSTNADVVSTNADVVSTNADATQTALDVIATTADAVQTALDVISTSTSASNAATSETNAGISEINAAASATSVELRQYSFSVTEEGAVGDGATDDTLAFQAALDAANAAGGGAVLIQKGSYRITDTLNIYSNTALVGEGKASRVLLDPAIDLPVFELNGVSGVVLTDFYVDGGGALQTGGASTHGFNVIGASHNVIFTKVEVTNCYSVGIYIAGSSYDTIIDGCYIHDTGSIAGNLGRGVWVFGASNVSVVNNIFRNCDGFAITVSESSVRCEVVSNAIMNPVTYDGILVHTSSWILVANNLVSQASDTGIVFELCGNCTAIGNIIDYTTLNGIYLAGSSYCTVCNNQVQNSSQSANDTYNEIIISSSGATISSNNIISGNMLLATDTNKSKYGILEDLTNTPNVIVNNIISGPVTSDLSLVTESYITPTTIEGMAVGGVNAAPVACTTLDTPGLEVDAAGIATNAKQPAFLAYVAADDVGATGNGVTRTLQLSPLFDQDNNFAANTFTAPVSGRYQLGVQVKLKGMTSAATSCVIEIVTSNRRYETSEVDPNGLDTERTFALNVLADMDALDTAYIWVTVSGEAGLTVDIDGGSPHTSFFSGFLAA